MSDKSKIEWTDATWNPVTGCTKVSPGCDNCYAETFAERFRGTPGHYFEQGFGMVLRPERLSQPLRWKKPRRIFVNSMSDLFHDGISDEYIAKVFAVMAASPQHTFQLLTKRHGRMRSLLRDGESFLRLVIEACSGQPWQPAGFAWPLHNVWLGVSVESQTWATIRIPALLETPAAVRWLSCEPLLGPVDLRRWLHMRPIGENFAQLPLPRGSAKHIGLTTLDWVVVGGESGHGARPMHPDWARTLRDQCTAAEVPFLFKQWGEWQDGSHDPRFQNGTDHVMLRDGRHVAFSEYSTSDLVEGDPRLRDGACVISKVGKKSAGRDLDGRTWDEYPAVVDAAI